VDLSSIVNYHGLDIRFYCGRREFLKVKEPLVIKADHLDKEQIERIMKEWKDVVAVSQPIEVTMLNKSIGELCQEAFETAKSKGWHENPRSFGEFISLVHAEVSEALEADRRNEGKERVAEELADVLIRIFDGAIEFGVDIETAILTKMAFNKTRSYKHGNKKY
jgi:NTP pyrophosphatase (non-canonical NTP hydrolase)